MDVCLLLWMECTFIPIHNGEAYHRKMRIDRESNGNGGDGIEFKKNRRTDTGKINHKLSVLVNLNNKKSTKPTMTMTKPSRSI